jgi:hypothetical protein
MAEDGGFAIKTGRFCGPQHDEGLAGLPDMLFDPVVAPFPAHPALLAGGRRQSGGVVGEAFERRLGDARYPAL